MLSRAGLSELIGRIYECSLDPRLWDAVLEQIRDVFNARNAQLFSADNFNGRVLIAKSIGIAPEWLERQADHAEETSRWSLLPAALALPPDEPQVASRHFPESHWTESRYYKEWAKPQKLFESMNLSLVNTVTNFAGLGIGRLETAGLFTDDDIELARLLSPHLRRAITISNILQARTLELQAMNATFDELRFGVVLVDQKSGILRANDLAEAMLRTGGVISGIGGVLQAKTPAATGELKTAIRLAAEDEAAIGNQGIAIRLTPRGEVPVLAHVLPIRHRASQMNAVAAIFIGGSDSNVSDSMAVAFDLTPSETRLVDFLLRGDNLIDAAAHLSISLNTAKTHLRHVFAKTGAARQADLTRLAAKLASPAGNN
jgi:DNA-binding CsgD family transcriptional regulator